MKLTPGTWRYDKGFAAIVVVHNHELRAVADFGKVDLPDTDANARLMAASKLLLGALEAVTDYAQDCAADRDERPRCISAALEAIKKAREG